MPIFRGKQFVSAESDYKDSARVVQRSNINLNTLIYTIDNISLVHKDRVLLVGQTNSAQNGIYSWNSITSKLIRANDADSNNEVNSGLKVYIEEGDVNAKTTWVLTTPGVIVLGTTPLIFFRENRLGVLDDTAGTYGSGSKSAVITIDEFGMITQITEVDLNLDAGEF
jgi:phage-related tail fiber protein